MTTSVSLDTSGGGLILSAVNFRCNKNKTTKKSDLREIKGEKSRAKQMFCSPFIAGGNCDFTGGWFFKMENLCGVDNSMRNLIHRGTGDIVCRQLQKYEITQHNIDTGYIALHPFTKRVFKGYSKKPVFFSFQITKHMFFGSGRKCMESA